MALPLAIIKEVVKGVVDLLTKAGSLFAAYLAGRASVKNNQVKEENDRYKEAAKLDDGVNRANGSLLDDILHD